MVIQIIALILNLTVAITMSREALSRPRRLPGWSLSIMAFFAAIWLTCLILLGQPGFSPFALYLTAAVYFSSVVAASAQFSYVVWQSNRQHWVNRIPWGLFVAMPILTQFLFWVQPWHSLLFGTASAQSVGILFFAGAWGRITALYIFSLLFTSALLFWNAFLKRPHSIISPFGAVLPASMLPPLAAALDLAGFPAFAQIQWLPIAFTLTGLGYSHYFRRRKPDVVASIDRNAVVEGMDDGWMVLDSQNTVVDMNPAAERMAGVERTDVLGQPVSSMLGTLPNFGLTFNQSQELEMKRSIRSEDGWKYLNIRISPLSDLKGELFGRLALWHDVTERKLTEDARQRARDEMLVLLNAISSAASNQVDIDDFLSESIYHIIYPFRSQVVGFFLADEQVENKTDRRFLLSAHLGLSIESAAQLACVEAASPLFAPIVRDREPLQIEDMETDERVPPALREMALTCLLVLPLVTQSGDDGQVLGCMCLARKDKPVYSPDEVVRLTMIADQIATLIDGDRRRKLAITSTERKRLMRDLHDSVSQKLYGLVTTTEAAQAAIEAGSVVNPSEILARIGDNARQAVKEMRLFLFQMQPIDMEKDGLISLLHHRLAAVEGRADIKARLLSDLADAEIALSKESEVMLYYIAQEALNNILRHASAKSISVTLKQGRRNVILEILDDGCGFDPRKVERGGLGLVNMQERTAQIHGKLKIVSKQDKGTRIVITVPKDPSVKPVRHRR
ncbi:MAG: ATP-binding protein [Anaerolineales bacterium]